MYRPGGIDPMLILGIFVLQLLLAFAITAFGVMIAVRIVGGDDAVAVDPPANARRDSEIICDLARRLDKGKYFPFETPREIFEELREASRGGHADYYGITYEKIDAQMGVFWPCPSLDHPGTREGRLERLAGDRDVVEGDEERLGDDGARHGGRNA